MHHVHDVLNCVPSEGRPHRSPTISESRLNGARATLPFLEPGPSPGIRDMIYLLISITIKEPAKSSITFIELLLDMIRFRIK